MFWAWSVQLFIRIVHMLHGLLREQMSASNGAHLAAARMARMHSTRSERRMGDESRLHILAL